MYRQCTVNENFLSQRSERFSEFSILNLGTFWMIVKRSNNRFILLLVQKRQWRSVVISQGGDIVEISEYRTSEHYVVSHGQSLKILWRSRGMPSPGNFSILGLWNGVSCILRALLRSKTAFLTVFLKFPNFRLGYLFIRSGVAASSSSQPSYATEKQANHPKNRAPTNFGNNS